MDHFGGAPSKDDLSSTCRTSRNFELQLKSLHTIGFWSLSQRLASTDIPHDIVLTFYSMIASENIAMNACLVVAAFIVFCLTLVKTLQTYRESAKFKVRAPLVCLLVRDGEHRIFGVNSPRLCALLSGSLQFLCVHPLGSKFHLYI